jgi:hypothetical protein
MDTTQARVEVTWETTQGLLENEWIYIREDS